MKLAPLMAVLLLAGSLPAVALADDALGRRGRMREAIAEIGRGRECFEGEPFALELN